MTQTVMERRKFLYSAASGRILVFLDRAAQGLQQNHTVPVCISVLKVIILQKITHEQSNLLTAETLA